MKKLFASLTVLMLVVFYAVSGYSSGTSFDFKEAQKIIVNSVHTKTITSNYTATIADTGTAFNVNAAAGPVTITLPPIQSNRGSSIAGTSYIINKTDSTFNAVTVVASTSDTTVDTIETSTQRILQVPNGTMIVKLNTGYDWSVVWETNPLITNMNTGFNQSVGMGMNPFISTPTVSTTYTTSDCGKTIDVATDALTFTLPRATPGCRFRFVNTGVAGNNIISIASTTYDQFVGTTYVSTGTTAAIVISSATGSVLTNTKSTAKLGDNVDLVGIYSGATGTWLISSGTGTWTAL